MRAMQRQQGFVLDEPLNGFAAGELHGLGDGGRQVDVPLFAGLALNELDFGRKTHERRGLSG